MRNAVIGLFLAAGGAACAGCSSTRPVFTFEMNGRLVEFEGLDAGKVPPGVGVEHFDSGSMRVAGSQPVEINGLGVLVNGNRYTIGGHKFEVDRDARVRVLPGGGIDIHIPAAAGPPAPVSDTPSEPQGSSK